MSRSLVCVNQKGRGLLETAVYGKPAFRLQ
jgi:hypothetical protein